MTDTIPYPPTWKTYISFPTKVCTKTFKDPRQMTKGTIEEGPIEDMLKSGFFHHFRLRSELIKLQEFLKSNDLPLLQRYCVCDQTDLNSKRYLMAYSDVNSKGYQVVWHRRSTSSGNVNDLYINDVCEPVRCIITNDCDMESFLYRVTPIKLS